MIEYNSVIIIIEPKNIGKRFRVNFEKLNNRNTKTLVGK